MPNVLARADQFVELRAAIEQRWKEFTITQQKFADRRTKPREFTVYDTV